MNVLLLSFLTRTLLQFKHKKLPDYGNPGLFLHTAGVSENQFKMGSFWTLLLAVCHFKNIWFLFLYLNSSKYQRSSLTEIRKLASTRCFLQKEGLVESLIKKKKYYDRLKTDALLFFFLQCT